MARVNKGTGDPVDSGGNLGAEEGTDGIGHTGYTKYGAEGAKVTKNGGNSEIQNGVRREASPTSIYKSGSYGTDGAAAN